MNLKKSFKSVFTNKYLLLNILILTLVLTISIYASNRINSIHQIMMIKKSIYLQFINHSFDPMVLGFMDNIMNIPAFLLIQTFCIYFIHKQLKSQIEPTFENNKTNIFAFMRFFPQGIISSVIYSLYFIVFYVLMLYLPLILKLPFILLFILLIPFVLISYSENLKIADALNIKKILSRTYNKIHLYIYALLIIAGFTIVRLIISIIEWRTIYPLSYGFITNYISLSILILFLSICAQLYTQRDKVDETKEKPTTKKKIKIIVIAIIIPLIIVSLPMLAIWYLSWTLGLYWDGPFYGVERMKCPTVNPDQSLEIWNKMTLNVYDKTESDIAPTVQVLDSNQQQQLCMYATEAYKDDPKRKIGRSRSSVKKIRFSEKYNSTVFYKNPRIKGFVDWSGGPEGAIWIFSRDGKLKQYYFSW